MAWLGAEIKRREAAGEPTTDLVEEYIMLKRGLEGGGEVAR